MSGGAIPAHAGIAPAPTSGDGTDIASAPRGLGWAPQDGGAEALLGDHEAQRGVRGQEMVLPDDIFQPGGAQAVGEGPGGLLVEERQGRFHWSLGSEADTCADGASRAHWALGTGH